MATPIDRLTRIIDNYLMLLLMVTETIANPTRANIDAVVAAASTSGLIQPQITYSVDGETYNWTEYQTMLTDQLGKLVALKGKLSGPYEKRTRGMV